ncbi:MAG: FKBP-type peptidyl-prolyl cis-trans isomerase [Bacteroidia bacterium]|jgi:FKBP-type peptidyl-prolyl cis-trans isomerase FkpA|nr:FKBP-type peptidyl-prolyl cis-trans isomerase [Bacteroidia bacterium]|tara:strand:+ start:589 stop:1044 length:456 start_codon:yes stop_codon:yes gene_type:complete
MNIKLWCIASALFIVGGCNKESTVDEDKAIQDYLTANDLTAEKTAEGLYYIITKEGTGDRANITSTVTVHYRGYLLDGSVFDSSYDRAEKSTFPLANVIEGWQLGIPKLKEGGSGKLLIPSKLAYGESGRSNSIIGANEPLVFDIELFIVE